MRFTSYIFLSLVAFNLASCKQGSNENSPSSTSPSSEKSSPSIPIDSSRPSKPAAEADVLFPSRLSSDFDTVSTQVNDLLLAHPERAAEILEHFALKLYEEDPSKAIDLLLQYGHLTADQSADRLATELLRDWKESDPASLESRLHKLAEHYGGTEIECNRTLVLLMQEQDQDFSPAAWLDWVNQLSDGRDDKGELQGEALNAILSLTDASDSSQFEPIAKAYQERLQDPGMQKHIPEFGDIMAKHYPEKTEALLADMPGGLYRETTLERTIAELGRSHPEVAAEWLSSQDILTKIYRPEFEESIQAAIQDGIPAELIAESEKAFQDHIDDVFDRTLETYIYSLVHHQPDNALENIDSMIDPEKREVLRTRVQAIIDAVPDQ